MRLTTGREEAFHPVVPFLKWPGGKRWAAAHIAEIIKPRLLGTYFEPFLGGGAVFFYLGPRRAVLSDVNGDLINTYRAVRDDLIAVLRKLRRFRVSAEEYYRIRELSPADPIACAARFLYLNRTAFGGVYRLNLRGQFNVPFGGGDRTPELLWKSPVLREAATALRKASLKQSDFEKVMRFSKSGDVVYCDPTYTVAHDNNGFIRYNERNFSWSDQVRLAKASLEASRRGVTVAITNANHASVRHLYPGARFEELPRISRITPKSNLRRGVTELLILLN
jgi:DNA adenine methylase